MKSSIPSFNCVPKFEQCGQFDDAPEDAWLDINLQTVREQIKTSKRCLDSSFSDAGSVKLRRIIPNAGIKYDDEVRPTINPQDKKATVIKKECPDKIQSTNKVESINLISENDAGSILPNDVLCGRGKNVCSHPGNLLFRDFVVAQLNNYDRSRKSTQKQGICRLILGQVKSMDPPGRFLKKSVRNGSAVWEELDDQKVMYKIAQALRDFLNSGRIYKPEVSSKVLVPRPDEVISVPSSAVTIQ